MSGQRGFSGARRRLTWTLGGIFLVLICASVALIVQSFDRLRFEAVHAQRTLAEDAVARVQQALVDRIATEQARAPTDYDFLVVSGERHVQRSPLSVLPPQSALPGIVGYFQVDADGRFTTPLLPVDASDPEALNLSAAELEERRAFESRLRQLLQPDEERRTAKAAAAPQPGPAGKARLGDLRLFDQLSSAESSYADAAEPAAAAPPERRQTVRQVSVEPAGPARERLRITAFQSEVDPLSLDLLGDEHLVLYRKVWLGGRRIQGAVLEKAAFLDAIIGRAFSGSALARSSSLLVAFAGEVVHVYPAASRSDYGARPAAEDRSLLLRARLAAPADPVELIFNLEQVPPGPGASILVWTSALMAMVLGGGFLLLLRLGRQQIRLAEQQHDFVSAVSHELKTPLTAIRMYAEMLKGGWTDPQKREGYYDYILSESERLSRLIGNVLTLARITRSSDLPLSLEPRAVGRLMDLLRSKTTSLAEAAGLDVLQIVEPDVLECLVDVDEDAFMQVMLNLVDNAIKFSPPAASGAPAPIEVGCRRRGGRVEFRVRDFGPGIPRGKSTKIFGLFYRAGNELTRETPGTGIGLALVRELAGRMGGSVDVVNRQPGAEFRVGLPVTRAAAGPTRAR